MGSTSNVTGANAKSESLRGKSNRLFKYQQTHKTELPAPPTPTQRRLGRVNASQIARKSKSARNFDNNRKLHSYGFGPSTSKQVQNVDASVSSTVDYVNSIFQDQTEKLNVEIAESLINISKMKETFNNEIKNVLTLADKDGNVSEAICKLCSLIQLNNDNICSLHETTQQNLLKLLALQKDLELSNTRRDTLIMSNSDRIQSIETKMTCSKDLHKIWITFTCNKELEQLKQSGDLINEAKLIFKRMNIDVDRLGILPIRTVNFQHIKVEKSVIPSLCVMFNNDKIASIVRRSMMKFNATLDEENRLDELRYSERIYWSKDVWKILKICWELKRLKLVEYVNVHAEGIRVQYQIQATSGSDSKSSSMNITCFKDIDKLRKIVGDIYPEISSTTLYDNNYFVMSFAERDARRSSDFQDETAIDNEGDNMDY